MRKEIFMQIQKKRIIKEDGRYLIYYTFIDETKEKKEDRDVRTKVESHPEAVDNHSHSSTEQDL